MRSVVSRLNSAMQVILKSESFSILVFCFYSFILLIPGGASLFATLLVVLSVLVFLFLGPRRLGRSDQVFALCLFAYPLLMIPSLLVKGGVWDFFDYPVRVLLFLPLILGLRGLANPASFQKFLYLGCNIGGIFAAVFSIKSLLLDHIDRVGIPITASIAFGQIAAILGVISFASIFESTSTSRKIIASLGFIGSAFAINSASSTGALLGFIAGLVVLGLYRIRNQLLLSRPRNIILLFVIAFALVVPLALKDFPRIYHDVFVAPPDSYMFTGQGHRLLLWGIAIKEIASSPLFGIGPGHFDHIIQGYCLKHFCVPDFAGYRGVHNQFLDSAMNAGIIGLIGLLVSYLGSLSLFVKRVINLNDNHTIQNAAVTGMAVISAGMVSCLSQVLYGHNISVISYYFTITFLWFLADQPSVLRELDQRND